MASLVCAPQAPLPSAAERLTTRQAAAYVGIGYQSFRKLRRKRGGPVYHLLPGYTRGAYYLQADLDAWLATSRAITPGTQEEE
jgi:hypothetical protein